MQRHADRSHLGEGKAFMLLPALFSWPAGVAGGCSILSDVIPRDEQRHFMMLTGLCTTEPCSGVQSAHTKGDSKAPMLLAR